MLTVLYTRVFVNEFQVWFPGISTICHIFYSHVTQQAHSYLNILFEFLKEHLFVILINMNLLAIINKIIVFERRQLFGLKQTKIPVRAGVQRGVWWSCWQQDLQRPPVPERALSSCLSSMARSSLPNCTHGTLSLAHPSWKWPRSHLVTCSLGSKCS